MTTERPYRGALGEDEVRSEFVRRRGEQFDPGIVDTLLSDPVWQQLFTPPHRATRNHRLSLIGSGEQVRINA
jgi:response regulator RpfG family c-di-GMP phosphodiesterase